MSGNPRDTLVTGMGFCLPGPGGTATIGREQFWQTIMTGACHVQRDGLWYGQVPEAEKHFALRFPEIPERHVRNYSRVHFFGLLSLAEALDDADLDYRGDDLADAAVLTARAASDSWFDAFAEYLAADPDQLTPRGARDVFTRLAISGGVPDVTNVQIALTGSGGPNFTLSCGCASSAVLLGTARRMIADGEIDLALVTGVDYYSLDRLPRYQRLVELADGAGVPPSHTSAPPAAIRFDRPMRPYDERADGANLGEGSATLVLESREHAERRGRAAYGRILAQATRRIPQRSAIAVDEAGVGVRTALERTLAAAGLTPDQVDYVNGGAEGDAIFNLVEANALRAVFGGHLDGLPVTSQEACFGHSGSPLGAIGVAATLLMMQAGQVCPTANCERPDPSLPFDPVPSAQPAEHVVNYALSINHQVGGVASAVALAAEDQGPRPAADTNPGWNR